MLLTSITLCSSRLSGSWPLTVFAINKFVSQIGYLPVSPFERGLGVGHDQTSRRLLTIVFMIASFGMYLRHVRMPNPLLPTR